MTFLNKYKTNNFRANRTKSTIIDFVITDITTIIAALLRPAGAAAYVATGLIYIIRR